MYWRFAHRFFVWAPPALAGFYGATLVIAGQAAPINAQAKVFLDGQIACLEAVVNSAWFLPLLGILVLIWLGAFLWTGVKAEENAIKVARASNATPPAVQERKHPHPYVLAERSLAGLKRALSPIPADRPPKAAFTTPRRDAPLVEGLAYVHKRRWGEDISDLNADEILRALDKLEQAAADDDVTVWGRRIVLSIFDDANEIWEPIDEPRFWVNNRVKVVTLMSDNAATESRGTGTESSKQYAHLMVNRMQFEEYDWDG